MTPERKERLLSVINKRQANLTVVLENVEDPHNVSAVLRTCDAVGIQDVYLLTTKLPRHKKWGVKSSSSAIQWLTVHEFDDTAELVKTLRSRYGKIYTTHLADGAKSLYDIDFTGSVALVFGNEQTGVSEDFRQVADGNFVIPMMGIIKSLNISVAAAVSIYEAMRQKNAAGQYNTPSLPEERRIGLLTDWKFPVEEL
ncbi:RNA methyltransferase [Chitinophaga sp.]|uniref:TrmH family RNA methyltransferase n=1 Tax=Chitinophaga sp. TaxID=1869181 RepID=UPI00261641FA|nr:RNA methyltransferase [uncultured Chitinophaga sp.]